MSILKGDNLEIIQKGSSIKAKNFKTGRLGEEIAKKYLQSNRYAIVEQNYRTKRAEIDLIALHRGILVFIEVRTKIGERFGMPEESLNKNKKIKLINNARAYVTRQRWEREYRIDAICIVLGNDYQISRINHYKNITF